MAEQIESFYKDLGNQIRILRAKREMTQEDLARRLIPRVTRAAIANIEGGKQRVLAHTLWQLAHALDVSPAELAPATTPAPKDSRAPNTDLQGELTNKLGLPKSKARRMMSQLKRGDGRGKA